jgi:hypothetical protein
MKTRVQQQQPKQETREEAFERFKSELENALIAGNSDKIIEGYRNLGQHFMQGKSVAEHQAAKQMFEKALEHAGVVPVTSPQKQQQQQQQQSGASSGRDSPSMSSQQSMSQSRQHSHQQQYQSPAPQADSPQHQQDSGPVSGPRTVVLNRRPLPGMGIPPDGLVG